jgi:N-acetylmuramoyl-L-alanine amidase CwlA
MKKITKAKKKKIQHLLIIIGAATAVSLLIIAIIIGVSHLLRPAAVETAKTVQLDYSKVKVEKPAVSKKLLTKNKNSRPGKALKQVNGVVVHYTANPGTDALANRNYFESRKDCPDEGKYKVSSHYIIGLDGTIIQCIPEDEIAYASNNRNSDTISIECCHPDSSGKFTDETYQSLIHLTAYLCAKYTLPVDSIIRHYDVTQKLCPKYYVEHPKAWNKYKKKVFSYLLQH